MALVVKDRVRETTTTTGTGTVTLLGAVTGYQSFSAIGNANTTYYAISGQGGAEWETGLGTYTLSGTTLSRDTVYSSSNGGTLVTFSAGTKDVYCVQPSSRTIILDSLGNATALGTPASGNASNLTSLTAGNLTGTIPSGVLGNSTLYVGTTAIVLNRGSATQALTGITSIDGVATGGTGTNAVTLAMLAQIATASFLGRITGATGNVEVLTPASAATLLSGQSMNIVGSASTITGVYGGTLTSSQVTTALTFTPYNATNPSGYVTASVTLTTAAQGNITSVGTLSSLTVSGLTTGAGFAALGGSTAAQMFAPNGTSYWSGSSANTGAIAITLPRAMNGAMVRMTIQLYQYSTNTSFTVYCGGYMYGPGASWANNPFAYILGHPGVGVDFTVRFGYTAGGKGVIYIGELASSWAYLNVHVTDIQVGFADYTMDNWKTGWSIGYQASAFENVTATLSNNLIGRYLNGLDYSTSGVANTIVQRDGSGYISNSYFYNATGGAERNVSGMGYFSGHNSGDYYIRSYTAAAAAILLSGQAMNIVGSASTITGVYGGTLTSSQITTALTFTPYNATNPSGYITSSGTSAACSGNAATVTNATFVRQFTMRDDRTDGNDYSLSARATGLYAIAGTGTNNPSGSSYCSLLHISNSTDVAFQITGGYTTDSMWFRGTSALQSGTGYTTWRKILHDGNYNSYSPTLTGTGASGTWGISITGTSANITAYTINQSVGTANSPQWATGKPIKVYNSAGTLVWG